MRILLVHPGASFSVADVYNGLLKALKNDGHEVITYRTDSYLMASGKYLEVAHEFATAKGMDVPTPSQADIFYHSSLGLLEKALRFLPDFVLVMSGMYIHPDVIVMLRRAGIKVSAVLTESPYQDWEQSKLIKHLNWAYTNELHSVDALRTMIPSGQVHYLPHAFDPDVHTPEEVLSSEYYHDVVFVGSGFEDRISLLEGVNWKGIDLGLYGVWETVKPSSPIYRSIRDNVIDNTVATKIYRRSTIGLNIYRKNMYYDDDERVEFDAYSMNPRVLELAACGTFFLSDDRPEQREVFGSTLPTFTTSAELERLIRYYLDDSNERNAIAKRLPELVQGRTFKAMAERIVETAQVHIRE